MKPLDPEGRRLIDDVLAADQPDPSAAARSWSALAERLHEPLPPTAAAAEAALEASGPLAKAGVLAQLGGLKVAVVAGVMCVAGGVWFATQQPAAVPAPPQPRAVPAATATPSPAEHEHELVPQPAAAGSTLSEEARLIALAQRALSAGNPARALALIEEHRRSYAGGALAQERDAARVLVLCALGRSREARDARKQFLRDWPGSALTARVRSACNNPR
jgi:hypothetical protein